MTGCSDKSSNADDDTQVDETVIKKSSSITGKAVDGYLMGATVCLDLSMDGFCQSPFTLTDNNGSFNINLTQEQQDHENYKKAMLLVYGGQDSDRPGEHFAGKLEAPNDGSGQIIVTPITSLISAYLKENDLEELTEENIKEAKTKVATILKIDVEKVDDDPRENNDKDLINATLQLQHAANSLVTAAKKDGSLSDEEKNDLARGVFSAFAAGLDEVEGESLEESIASIIEKAPAEKLHTNAVKAKEAAKVAAKNINEIISKEGEAEFDAESLNDALTKVVVLQDKIIKELEKQESFDEFEFVEDEFIFDENQMERPLHSKTKKNPLF
jgi:hypothetical protein